MSRHMMYWSQLASGNAAVLMLSVYCTIIFCIPAQLHVIVYLFFYTFYLCLSFCIIIIIISDIVYTGRT